ncbi:MAG: SPOR domain-containing protein [Geothrix sp.]|uniref:SPOR domain-containing protein n=1 Tax=Geothrix sp. TaxID=1962974 RepID=UPI001839400A|nr:SPOR domain-containing protein [Geothrix sp.]NWJ40892.1 SPOR domain-containing protein [Geothrix sp.]WIL21108.1 MAG: SPOR domain-containing protein [Geothrix sp.]
MNTRDQISIQSQSILWVAGVGVGLLTLAFVLGVQVGKQSAALRRPMQKGVEEELKDLPEPLVDQLKFFEGEGPDKLVPTQKVDAAAPKEEPKPEPKAEVKPAEKAAEPEAWTLQLVATAEAAEAKRVADKAKTAGFATTTVKEKGQLKVRLTKATDRAAADKTAEKLKKAGFKPFAVKVE